MDEKDHIKGSARHYNVYLEQDEYEVAMERKAKTGVSIKAQLRIALSKAFKPKTKKK